MIGRGYNSFLVDENTPKNIEITIPLKSNVHFVDYHFSCVYPDNSPVTETIYCYTHRLDSNPPFISKYRYLQQENSNSVTGKPGEAGFGFEFEGTYEVDILNHYYQIVKKFILDVHFSDAGDFIEKKRLAPVIFPKDSKITP